MKPLILSLLILSIASSTQKTFGQKFITYSIPDTLCVAKRTVPSSSLIFVKKQNIWYETKKVWPIGTVFYKVITKRYRRKAKVVKQDD